MLTDVGNRGRSPRTRPLRLALESDLGIVVRCLHAAFAPAAGRLDRIRLDRIRAWDVPPGDPRGDATGTGWS